MGGVHSASTADGSRNWRYLSTEDSQCVTNCVWCGAVRCGLCVHN